MCAAGEPWFGVTFETGDSKFAVLGRAAKKLATWPRRTRRPRTPPSAVNAVELENVLRDVDPDGANLGHGWLLLLLIFDDHLAQMP
jgi:hypothetical protein